MTRSPLVWIASGLLLVGVGFVVGMFWERSGIKSSDRLLWEHERDSVLNLNNGAQWVIDSLQVVIEEENATQRYLDSLGREIDRDPRYEIGTYRDSSTETKLDFIIGRR